MSDNLFVDIESVDHDDIDPTFTQFRTRTTFNMCENVACASAFICGALVILLLLSYIVYLIMTFAKTV